VHKITNIRDDSQQTRIPMAYMLLWEEIGLNVNAPDAMRMLSNDYHSNIITKSQKYDSIWETFLTMASDRMFLDALDSRNPGRIKAAVIRFMHFSEGRLEIEGEASYPCAVQLRGDYLRLSKVQKPSTLSEGQQTGRRRWNIGWIWRKN
jgi:hypothetical protein